MSTRKRWMTASVALSVLVAGTALGSDPSQPQAVYVTGSRIPVSVAGSRQAQSAAPLQRVYRQDIALSGQTEAAGALRMLVPAQSVASGAGSSGR